MTGGLTPNLYLKVRLLEQNDSIKGGPTPNSGVGGSNSVFEIGLPEQNDVIREAGDSVLTINH
jgi:hypothetical protein